MKTSNVLFAAWLAENQPAVFNLLLKKADPAAKPQQLEGFTDVLKSIGSAAGSAARVLASGLSTAVKSVGSFLGSSSGQQTLQTALQVYAATQLPAAQTIAAQNGLAQAGQAPADVQMQWSPAQQQWIPTGNVAALKPSFMDQYGPWLLAGAAALLALLILRK